MGNRNVCITKNCKLRVPDKPHISFPDGWHLVVDCEHVGTDKSDLPPDVATELLWLTMVAGRALHATMWDLGYPLYQVNYQDNGNWPYLEGKFPHIHTHIYGRAKGETLQTYGQALVLPDPHDEYYDKLEIAPASAVDLLASYVREVASAPDMSWGGPLFMMWGGDGIVKLRSID